ncbi:MAG: phosphoribosylglycinamide formyltransferase [Oscillospiraceae bacterium]|nr:phosphoribosylglycinamide formyltransferase [Oscillospiraceae bacterium]
MRKIVVLVSGGGTNLQALIDSISDGRINGRIVRVISSKPGVYALERAKSADIACSVVCRADYRSIEEYSDAIANEVENSGGDLVVMAGFLSILSQNFTRRFENAVINVHPSLVPAFCGAGYYGIKVHEAVLEYGAKITGATVHFVNEQCDGGPIILQKSIEVRHDDTPQSLQLRVMTECEHPLLVQAVGLFCQGRIEICGRKTVIV